jgi:hypothetical protein
MVPDETADRKVTAPANREEFARDGNFDRAAVVLDT